MLYVSILPDVKSTLNVISSPSPPHMRPKFFDVASPPLHSMALLDRISYAA